MSYYDNYAGRPEATALGRLLAERDNMRLARLMLQACMSEKPALLEIGPGKGLFARSCGHLFEYHALEANELMAESLAAEGFSVTHGGIPNAGLDSMAYAAILMDQVFEHIGSVTEQFAALCECRSYLEPNGILVIAAPDYLLWGDFFFDSDFTHNTVSTLHRTAQMLSDADYRIVYEGYYASGIWGNFPTFVLGKVVNFVSALGVLKLLGSARAAKSRSAMLRSFVVVAQRDG